MYKQILPNVLQNYTSKVRDVTSTTSTDISSKQGPLWCPGARPMQNLLCYDLNSHPYATSSLASCARSAVAAICSAVARKETCLGGDSATSRPTPRRDAPFPVVAAKNVHVPLRVDSGYLRCVNSSNFFTALLTITVSSLANFSSFLNGIRIRM